MIRLLVFSFLILLLSCKFDTDKSHPSSISDSTNVHDSTLENKDEADWVQKELDSLPEKLHPVMGYRFVITGDFDGDGTKEKIAEHFYSIRDKKETEKFDDSLEYDQLVAVTIRKHPMSFLLSENLTIDTLLISTNPQLLGLRYAKNEGDLNGDGRDELSYVVEWADWSNMNTCHIVSFLDGHWEELYNFPIRDWQLPDVPQTYNNYGLFGLQDKMTVPETDSLEQIMKKEFDNFPGLIKKKKKNFIQIAYISDDADVDTMIVNLNESKK